MERLRQTHSKDIENKDDEVEEIRQSCSKKVKIISLTVGSNCNPKYVPQIERERETVRDRTKKDQPFIGFLQTHKRSRSLMTEETNQLLKGVSQVVGYKKSDQN